MKILMTATIAIAAVAASGCRDTRPEAPGDVAEAACRAEAGQTFVGRPFTEELSNEARTATAARTVRVVRPGQAVTMDFRQDRLNIELDERDAVRAIRCG